METSDGIGEKARPALCITMKLPAITQFLLTVAAGHYIVKLLGNEPPRHTKHDAAAHFFKKPRRARARRQKIRARSAALFFHGGISDQHRPDIGAGLWDHQHPDQRDGVRPQHHRDIKAEAQHDGEPHPAERPVSVLLRAFVKQHDDQKPQQGKGNVAVDAPDPDRRGMPSAPDKAH